MSACTNDESSSVIELNSPVSTRMGTVVFDDWQYRVDITVNAGATQSFVIDPTETNLSVLISGVRANEENSIDILWHAILDGFDVEVSQQSQIFFADGGAIIDAPHNSEQFDFDGDGVSNLFELVTQTCIWSDSAICIHPDSIISETNNLIPNGDFSNGTDYWWSTTSRAVVSDGEICLNSVVATDQLINIFSTQLGHVSFALEANSSYTFSFDARAQEAATVSFGFSLPSIDNGVVFESDIEVFSTYNRYNFSFNTADDNFDPSALTFNLGTATENLYCFDNVVLERVVNE